MFDFEIASKALLFLIALTPLWHKSPAGLFISFSFCISYLLFHVIDPYLSDVAYYVTAALFDLLLVYLIGAVRPITKMAITLQRCCLASIIVNAFGFMCWYLYLSATAYNIILTLVHLCIAVSLWRGGRNGFTNNHRDRVFRFDFRSGILSACKGL